MNVSWLKTNQGFQFTWMEASLHQWHPSIRAWVAKHTLPNSMVKNWLALFESDGIAAGSPLGIASLGSEPLGWTFVHGYIGVYVLPEHRRKGLGQSLANAVVAKHGKDLLYGAQEPYAARMYTRAGLTRGPMESSFR